ADELVESHPDHTALRTKLDAVALDVHGDTDRHLGALDHDEDVVEHDRVLELEGGQSRQHLLEALAVRIERGQGLVRLRKDLRDRVALVPDRSEVGRARRALLRQRYAEGPVQLRAGPW